MLEMSRNFFAQAETDQVLFGADGINAVEHIVRVLFEELFVHVFVVPASKENDLAARIDLRDPRFPDVGLILAESCFAGRRAGG